MKCKVKEDSVIDGEFRQRGDIVEVSEQTADYWKGVLLPMTEQDISTAKEQESAKDEILVAGLTRDQTILKLKELGVNVNSRIGNARLKERFLETVQVDL